MVAKYDGLAEFIKVAKDCNHYGSQQGSWMGNISHSEAVQKTLEGDNSYVASAQELLDKVEAEVEIPSSSWQPSVYGAYPVVAEFLAGRPDCMRHRVSEIKESSPIAIYVSTTCSAMLDAETMQRRGTAILALVMKLQQIRPVELYLLAETHGSKDGEYLQVIKVESKPVEISVAAFVLAHVGFARHLTYSTAYKFAGFNGSWPNSYAGGGELWEKHVREVLGMGENDLYIGAARSWDDMITKPVEWVNTQVQHFCRRDEEE